MLIGGLLKVIVHWPGLLRSILNCEGSGMAPRCVAVVWVIRSSFWAVLYSCVSEPGDYLLGRLGRRTPSVGVEEPTTKRTSGALIWLAERDEFSVVG